MGLAVAKHEDLVLRPPRDPHPHLRRGSVIACLVLLAATVAVYYPVRHHPFFGIDDGGYVTQNPHVTGPLNWENVKWALTHQYCLNYVPVAFLANSLKVRMFQLDPIRHHDVNVVLHSLNAVLLFWMLKRCTGYAGRSFMVAALFALHPVNVESVAWVAELNTILSTTFLLLALAAYWNYALKPTRWRMALVSLLYVMGLLVKPQVITLPFVLLLLDYWPLRRMFAGDPGATGGTATAEAPTPRPVLALVREKFPLFIIMALDAVVTLLSEQKAAPRDWPYTFSIRLGNAILSYSQYLGKAFWPANLSYLHPHPGYALRWGMVWASLCLLVTITVFAVLLRQRRYLPVGWFWFLGTMVPMIGLVQIDLPAYADRWAYACFIGLYLVICWSAAEWAAGHRLRTLSVRTAGVAGLIVLALLTRHQIGFWKDDFTVWAHSAEANDRNSLAESMVGNMLEARGQHEEALRHLYRAWEVDPEGADVNWGIALAEHHRHHLQTAIRCYQKFLAVSDDRARKVQAWALMGHAYGELNDLQHAAECYRTATRLRAETPPASPPAPVIHWHGAWWREIGPYLRYVWLSH